MFDKKRKTGIIHHARQRTAQKPAADIEIQIGCDIELKEKATKLFSDKKKYDEVVGKLLKELESIGLIEKENELDGTYKVLSAFHYMEDLVDCITISEEVQDEIPE